MFPSPFSGNYPLTSAFKPPSRPNHTGEDYGLPLNTPLYAIFDGVVTMSTVDQFGGIYVVIQSTTENWKTMYVHNQLNTVKVGDKVKQGQLVAYSGNTGNSTGPHLHITLWKNNVKVKPSQFIDFNKSTLPPKPKPPTQKEIAMSALRDYYVGNFKEDHVNRLNQGKWGESYRDFVRENGKLKKKKLN